MVPRCTAWPTAISAVGTSADNARRQCASIAWLLSDVYSKAAVLALPTQSSTYLVKLLGLTSGARSAAAQADSVDAHRSAHHSKLADGAADGAAAGGGGGGNCNADGAIPGDDTGGLAPALLPSVQVPPLLAIPRGEILNLLDAAGVPHRAADTDADLRTKCATAAIAAEKLRSSSDVRALATGIQDRMLTSFEVPTAWRPDARH
jgi:hypothetical protein